MVDYIHAFRKPFSGIKTALVFFVLGAIGILSLGLLFIPIKGFVVQATRRHLRSDRHLPEIEASKIGSYFADGLKAMVIEFVYFLPALVFFAIAFGSLVFGFLSSGTDTLLLSKAILSSGSIALIGGVLLFLGWIVSLMAVVNFAEEEKLLKGFDIGTIFRKMLSKQFIVSLVACIAYFFILFFVFMLLSVISIGILGLVLFGGLFIYAYSLSVYTIMAETFLETR